MDKEQLKIWFAGFYEGEGTVSVSKTENHSIRISIYQNDSTPLYIGKDIWGGSVLTRTRKSPYSNKICTNNELRLNSKYALQFIKDIKPYMLIPYKIEQLEKAIKRYIEPLPYNFECKICKKIYKNKSNLYRHNKLFHKPVASQ